MISGEKISLRALTKDDSSKILKWVNNPELKYLTGTVYPISDTEHEKWFLNIQTQEKNKSFGIILNENEKIIGLVGLKNIDFVNRNTEIYIYIGEKEYWGQGYGSSAIQLLSDFVFNELNLHRITLSVFSYNSRAIQSYEKCGFEVEGILKEGVYKKGKYHDVKIMGMIKNKTIEGK